MMDQKHFLETTKKYALRAVKTIEAKNPTQDIIRLRNEFYDHDNNHDCKDLSQIAALALIEETKRQRQYYLKLIQKCKNLPKKYTQQLLKKYHSCSIYNEEFINNIRNIAYKKVNSYIHSQKSNKGRRAIIQIEEIPTYPCRVYDLEEGNFLRIEDQDMIYLYAYGYNIELIPVNVNIENSLFCDDKHYLEDLYFNDYYNLISELLSPKESEVLKYVIEGYSLTEIANILNVKYGTVSVDPEPDGA